MELVGERLELPGGEAVRAEHDGERIPGEGSVGEHVDDLVRKALHSSHHTASRLES